MGRYKKGESGNPKGRPPKPKSERIDIRAMLEEALNSKLILRIGDKEELTTYLKAGLKRLAEQFVKGDAKARRDVFWLAEKYGLNLLEAIDENVREPLAAEQRAILEAYVNGRSAAVDRSAAAPIIAPPDLQDDDPSEGGEA